MIFTFRNHWCDRPKTLINSKVHKCVANTVFVYEMSLVISNNRALTYIHIYTHTRTLPFSVASTLECRTERKIDTPSYTTNLGLAKPYP